MRLIGLLLTLTLLSACTNSGSSVESSGALREPSVRPASCDKASITRAVLAFVSAWNTGDMTSLHSVITSDSEMNISTRMQGASGSSTDAYTFTTGWRQIRWFALRQHAAGQRFSFDRLRLVAGQGAYAVGMRAAYADGSTQSFVDAKFAYTCEGARLHRVVMVAGAPAR